VQVFQPILTDERIDTLKETLLKNLEFKILEDDSFFDVGRRRGLFSFVL